MKSFKKFIFSNKGTASVEEIVVLSTVAIGVAAATIPLGALLLNYHKAVEYILMMPIP